MWFGFAWFLSALHFADSAILYSIAFVVDSPTGAGTRLHVEIPCDPR